MIECWNGCSFRDRVYYNSSCPMKFKLWRSYYVASKVSHLDPVDAVNSALGLLAAHVTAGTQNGSHPGAVRNSWSETRYTVSECRLKPTTARSLSALFTYCSTFSLLSLMNS